MAQLATQLEIGRRIMRRTFLVIGVVVTFASQAGAQTTNQATNELIDKLLTRIAGFAGIGYSATDLHGPNGGFQPLTMLSPHSGFSEGQFVLQLSSALSSKVSVFSELSLTARGDAGTGPPAAPGFN